MIGVFFKKKIIEILSLLSADQFCNHKLFLHAAQKILYFPSACNCESHEAKSLIAFLCSGALYSPVAERAQSVSESVRIILPFLSPSLNCQYDQGHCTIYYPHVIHMQWFHSPFVYPARCLHGWAAAQGNAPSENQHSATFLGNQSGSHLSGEQHLSGETLPWRAQLWR